MDVPAASAAGGFLGPSAGAHDGETDAFDMGRVEAVGVTAREEDDGLPSYARCETDPAFADSLSSESAGPSAPFQVPGSVGDPLRGLPWKVHVHRQPFEDHPNPSVRGALHAIEPAAVAVPQGQIEYLDLPVP